MDYYEVKRRIEFLKRPSTALRPDDFINDQIARLLDSYHWRRVPTVMQGVFRARKNNNKCFFEHVDQLWYPPAEYVQAGRFNHRNDPAFYAASEFSAAALEVRPEVGDVITILLSVPKAQDAKLTTAWVGMSHCEVPIIKSLKPEKYAISPNAKWRLIDRYIGEISIGSPSNYPFTASLSKLLRQCPHIDGFQYPSVAANKNAVNILLPTQKADELLIPKLAFTIKINHSLYNRIDFFEVTHIGEISSDLSISWHPRSGSDLPNFVHETHYGAYIGL